MNIQLFERIFDSFRANLKFLLLQAGVARISILAIAFIPPFMILDWWIHLSTPWRLLALVAYGAGLGAICWWTLLRPLSRSWSNLEMLTYVDALAPQGKGMLLDLYELIRGEGIQELESAKGKELAELAVEDLAPLAQQVRLTESFERRRAWRWMSTSAVMLALAVVVGLAMGEYSLIGLERFFNPFSQQRWPHRTTITVPEPEHGWTVAQMEEFKVQAAVSGEVPQEVELVYRCESTGFTIKDRLPVGIDGQVTICFPEVREPLTFQVSGGDFTSDPYTLNVIERPYLKKITAFYNFPDYAGLLPKEAAGGQLIGLEGTQVRLAFECSLPLKKALFALDQAEVEEMALSADGKTFQKSLMLRKDGNYAIELYDPNGFREPKPERYEIRVIPDNLPEVELLGQDLIATKNVSVDMAYKAKDDFGLEKVALFYQWNNESPKLLSDRVTGDIKQDGKLSQGRFTWDLRKIDALPETGNITYYLQAQDINPTGRGKVTSQQLHIKLVKPSDFHREALEGANALITEAFLAWKNQGSPGPQEAVDLKEVGAYQLAGQWLQAGSGNDGDPLWQSMREKQEAAMHAANALKTHLNVLISQYERNHMEREFMSKRLGQISDLLKQLLDNEFSSIQKGLRQSKPPTEADAEPVRLKARRTEALEKFIANQRMAVVILERILRKTYDWRDLQTATITTTLLFEEQENVTATTERLAPKTRGLEREDLPDDLRDQVETLGKNQRVKFEAETQLESQLIQLNNKAEKEGRKNILHPLRTALAVLRNNRVNDNLKEAALKIEDSQLSAIIKNQKNALGALLTAKSGLYMAGQHVDEKEDPLSKDTPISLTARFEDPMVAQANNQSSDTVDPVPLNPPGLPPPDGPEGTDQVSKTIREAREEQDWVLSRTCYLGGAWEDVKNWEMKPVTDMPRYLDLKFGRLSERQREALLALDQALQAASKPFAPPAKADLARGKVRDALGAVKEEFLQSENLLALKDVSACVQQIQRDAIATLDDLLLQYLPFEEKLAEAVQENRERVGEDVHKRKLLLRDKDLDASSSILADTNQAKIVEKDVARKVNRFIKCVPQTPLAVEIEKANRNRASDAQRKVSELMVKVAGTGAALSAEVSPRVKEAGLTVLLELKPSARVLDLNAATKDKELATGLEDDLKVLASSLQSLRDLLEEPDRRSAEGGKSKKREAESKPPTPEEFEKWNSPVEIAKRLKASSTVPQDLRDKMVRNLEREFPPKYKQLLLHYYASMAGETKL